MLNTLEHSSTFIGPFATSSRNLSSPMKRLRDEDCVTSHKNVCVGAYILPRRAKSLNTDKKEPTNIKLYIQISFSSLVHVSV